MPARNKKDRKQQLRKKKMKRELAARKQRQARVAHERRLAEDKPVYFDEGAARAVANDANEPVLPKQRRGIDEMFGTSQEPPSEPSTISEREETEADVWWDKYSNADGVARLQLTREKLETISVDDQRYERYFPEAVFEMESKLSREDYVAFLEELREKYPEAFAQDADWHTRSIVWLYLAQGRLEDVDRAAMLLADEMRKVDEPFFSLVSTLRLAGRNEACRALIDAAVRKLEDSKLMYWAVEEILAWALFAHYQQCVANGVTDDAVEALHVAASELGIDDDEESRTNRRDFSLRLAGKSAKQWSKEELISGKRKAFHNIYMLSVDYQRRLCEERGLEAIVADEMRKMVNNAISGFECSFSGLLTGLPRRDFDQYLAGKLSFLSLDRIDAPATIIALKHYYDFLQELGLVKPKHWQNSQSVCDALWDQLKQAVSADEWRTYAFLEEYLPVAD